MSFIVQHKRNDTTNNDGSAVAPSAGALDYGELAMNYADGVETLYIKNSANSVVALKMSVSDSVDEHIADTDNPHGVTASQIGLGNADNTSDADKPITVLIQAVLDTKFNLSDLYNSYESSTEDLTVKAWTAAQGYIFKNALDAYVSGDTSAIEARIAWCETNV